MLSCYLVHEVVAAHEAGYYTTPERKFVVVLYNKMSTDKTQRAKLLLRTLLTPSNWTDPAPASLPRAPRRQRRDLRQESDDRSAPHLALWNHRESYEPGEQPLGRSAHHRPGTVCPRKNH